MKKLLTILLIISSGLVFASEPPKEKNIKKLTSTEQQLSPYVEKLHKVYTECSPRFKTVLVDLVRMNKDNMLFLLDNPFEYRVFFKKTHEIGTLIAKNVNLSTEEDYARFQMLNTVLVILQAQVNLLNLDASIREGFRNQVCLHDLFLRQINQVKK